MKFALVVLLMALLSRTMFADEGPRETAVEMTIEKLEISTDTILSKSFDAVREIRVRVGVSNNSDAAVALHAADLQLVCEGQAIDLNRVTPAPLLRDDRSLAPGDETAGFLAFPVIHNSISEPELQLSWALNGETRRWSLNAELRRLMDVKTELIGPANCLAVVSVNRAPDLETIWVLSKEFRDLQEAGLGRVVVICTEEGAARRRSRIDGWLSTAQVGLNQEPLLPGPGQLNRSPVQFAEFHVAGFSTATTAFRGSPRSSSADSSFIHVDREQAVAAALLDVYRRLPVEASLDGLHSPEPGVRRAALSTSIDRLTPEQLQEVISDGAAASVEQQALVAELLRQVSWPGAVNALHDFVMSSSAEVSQAGLSSLVRCLSPEADRVVHEIWQASADNAGFRGRIIDEILQADDDRWVPYVRESAVRMVGQASEPDDPLPPVDDASPADDDAPGSENNDDRKSTPPRESERLDKLRHPSLPHTVERLSDTGSHAEPRPLNGTEIRRLKRVLSFFQHRQDSSLIHFARARVLSIHDPSIQDRVLEFILNFGDSADSELARKYIDQRLPDGAITEKLIATVTQFPDTHDTATLISLSKKESLRSRERNKLLSAALQCATGRQLDPLIDDFENLEVSAQEILLQQLSERHHPRWIELAEKSLGHSPSRDNAVLRAIGTNTSPESLSLLLKLMEESRLNAAEHEQFEQAELNWARNLLTQIGTYSHPEAKRMINRCYISPSPLLQKTARAAVQRAWSLSPGRVDYVEMNQATLKHDYEAAMASANAAIAKDPFLADALHSRASLHLRNNNLQSAFDDLQEADRLNPEDIVAESTLSITQVRLGQVRQGLGYAEEILARIPEDTGEMRMITLYNTACAYARTDEVPTVADEDRIRYLDRAVELFSASIDLGANYPGLIDLDHVQHDPDLNALHDRPEWDSLLRQIAENGAKAAATEE